MPCMAAWNSTNVSLTTLVATKTLNQGRSMYASYLPTEILVQIFTLHSATDISLVRLPSFLMLTIGIVVLDGSFTPPHK